MESSNGAGLELRAALRYAKHLAGLGARAAHAHLRVSRDEGEEGRERDDHGTGGAASQRASSGSSAADERREVDDGSTRFDRDDAGNPAWG